MLLALSSTGAIELTAYATLGLAVVTGALAAATFWMVKLTRRALGQSQDEIAVSRREVEEAHRPVVVPLQDGRRIDFIPQEGDGVRTEAARPSLGGSLGNPTLRIPVENVGTGPAIHIEAAIELSGSSSLRAAITALRADGRTVVEVESGQKDDLRLPDYWLTLTYEDVAQKGWITKAHFVGSEDRYTDLTINTQEEGAYGLRKDSELLKPVTDSL